MDYPFTARLSQLYNNTPLELTVRAAINAIEEEGCHPLLTEALNQVTIGLYTIGAWTDAGEPGKCTPRPDDTPTPATDPAPKPDERPEPKEWR